MAKIEYIESGEYMEKEKRNPAPVPAGTGAVAKIKKAAGLFSVLLGTVLAVYIGIWVMIIKPIAGLYLTCKAGQLTFFFVIAVLVKCWLSLTVGGLIWSVGYMIKCMLD